MIYQDNYNQVLFYFIFAKPWERWRPRRHYLLPARYCRRGRRRA